MGASVKMEDAASTSGDFGVPILGVRRDSNADRTNADMDYGRLSLDAWGNVILSSRSVEAVYDAAGVAKSLGYGTNSSSMPVNIQSNGWAPLTTFIAYSTRTALAGAVHSCLANGTSSTKTLKVLRIEVGNASEAAVTGTPTVFRLHRSTQCDGGNNNTVLISTVIANSTALDANVRLSSITTTSGYLSVPLGSVVMTDEETTLTTPAILYDYIHTGEMPITLGKGEAIDIIQGALALSAGTFSVRIIFTQQ